MHALEKKIESDFANLCNAKNENERDQMNNAAAHLTYFVAHTLSNSQFTSMMATLNIVRVNKKKFNIRTINKVV